MSKEPIGLPRGSVRAIAFLALVSALIVGFLGGLVPVDQFIPMVTMAATYYFAARPTSS